jgi:septal ring factor EnvC (AmiA/AmiB activator)
MAAATAAAACLAAVPGASDAQPGLSQLNSELGNQQARQQRLEATLGGLSQMIGSLSGQIALVQSREAIVQAQLARDRAILAATQSSLTRVERRLAVLRARLARGRALLSAQLVSSYESDNPDLVSVVLEANGFRDLLERIAYLGDAEHQQQRIIAITRVAKAQTTATASRLSRLEATDRQATYDASLRARALAGMNSLLAAKQSTLRRAQSIQQASLTASRARAGRLRAQISQIEAQQAAERAAAAQAAARAAQNSAAATPSPGPALSNTRALGPSGGWAIPYAIVLCESGGQNLPPNGAGASGYYQILPATWRLFGGAGPAAYLASKAEQDAVASRIWAGGAGASNWACAAMVGIH